MTDILSDYVPDYDDMWIELNDEPNELWLTLRHAALSASIILALVFFVTLFFA